MGRITEEMKRIKAEVAEEKARIKDKMERTPADRDALADALLAWAADEGNIVASGEYEYEEYCVLCNQQVQLGPHADACLHLRARALRGDNG